ncbi:Hint domain-containing protein [Sulfitobacter sp. D35]|uniref:Hint domain-containing protein n=1 Tax=Sulfitobacter sp. D35 TaxID=3083252 RepID=UPI00296F89B7|nr:Hint domain-containing protein [Sulfitobacter sp. D35]MDW4499761.1 Hint domain-containing protein [Sulfitobacter sp. D35]
MSYQGKFAVSELVQPTFTGGIAEGANLRTPCGLRRIEIIRPGDLIVTRSGLEPVQMVWRRRVAVTPDTAPICLKPRAVGPMMPQRDLMLAPDHRVLIPGFRLLGVPDETAMLTEARRIAGTSDAVYVDMSCESVTYYQLVFDRHLVLMANGLPVESFLPDEAAIAALGGEMRTALEARYPCLRSEPDAYPGAQFPIATEVEYLPFHA